MTYRVIDLFCGAGGMTLGFAESGAFNCVLAVDNDPASIRTHTANFGESGICAGIEEWLSQEPTIPKADVVMGGPPCQGFSLLNKKRLGDDRRALWKPFLQVVERSNANIFIMENVAELFRSPELDQIRRYAARLGFAVQAAVLNAADYGTPQTRKRTVVIGWRSAKITMPVFPPKRTHAEPGTDCSLPRWITVRDAISDLASPRGTEIGSDEIYDLHFGRTPTAVSIARYRSVPPGGNRFDLQANALRLTPKCWVKKTSGGTDLFGRLWWDRPSVTIRTEFFKPEKGRYLHPVAHRPITHREAARLMGFPDTFKFKGNKIEIARQIGNAVPPPLALVLARVASNMLKRTQRSGQKNRTRSQKIGTKVAA